MVCAAVPAASAPTTTPVEASVHFSRHNAAVKVCDIADRANYVDQILSSPMQVKLAENCRLGERQLRFRCRPSEG